MAAARCPATDGMDSSLAGLGAARGWRRSGRFVASACSTMLIVAAGSRFPKANPPGRNSDAIAIGYGSRCGGSVGQSRRHDQEGGVSIVGEAGPQRGRQDPSHQDCCYRSAARRASEYGHPRRSVVCTPLCTAERLAHSPRKRQNEWRARQSGRRSELRGVGPVPPAAGSPRALAYAAPTFTYACGGLEDRERSPSTGTIGTSRRRTESASWLEMQALTATNPLTP
jgi:hypothetical protein